MIEETEKQKIIYLPVHRVKCDVCDKFICEIEEEEIGYYHNPAHYLDSIRIFEGSYEYKADLCEECKEKRKTALLKVLDEFGFKEKKY